MFVLGKKIAKTPRKWLELTIVQAIELEVEEMLSSSKLVVCDGH